MKLLETFTIPSKKIYNGLFTPMGRKNLRSRLKMLNVRLDSDYRRSGTAVYRLRDGRRFVFHRDNQLSQLIYVEGAYEPLETLIASRVIQPDDVVLDVGANVGYYSAIFDQLVRPGGAVHSFEPGTKTIRSLSTTKDSLDLNRTTLHQKAIGERVGTATFWDSTSGSDAQQSLMNVTALGGKAQGHEVEVTTIDSFIASLPTPKSVAFVKCDIEGAEPSMLRGAKELLSSENPPIWLIEHNRPALHEHGNDSGDLLLPLKEYQIAYVPLTWPPSILASPQAIHWEGDPWKLPDECNLIALPRYGAYAGRAAKLRECGLLP